MPRHLLFAVTLCALLFPVASLDAKTPPRLGAGASFGVGGEYVPEDGSDAGGEDLNAAPSFGALLQARFTLAKFFSLGLRPSFLAYRSELEADRELGRSYALNTNGFLQLQFEFGEKHNLFYLGGFGGPAFTFPSSDTKEPFALLGLDLGAGRAWNYGGMIGIDLQGARDDPGLFIEASYLAQQIAYNVKGDIMNGGSVDDDVTGQFWQIVFNVGVTFAIPN